MRLSPLLTLPLLAASLAACDSEADREAEATEDRIEQEADASAAAAGDEIAALGLTERQLLDADLVTADGTELGDVEQVRRDAAGAVSELLVEVEDSDPDRFVLVPLDGLSIRASGNDSDLQTTMSAEDIAGLPDAELDAAATTAVAEPAAQ